MKLMWLVQPVMVYLLLFVSHDSTGQDKRQVTVNSVINNLRVSVDAGFVFRKPFYHEWQPTTIDGFSSNWLAGFESRAFDFTTAVALDYNFFNQVKFMDAYLGIGYLHYQGTMVPVVDSVMLYNPDPHILDKSAVLHGLAAHLAVNLRKITKISSEVGVSVGFYQWRARFQTENSEATRIWDQSLPSYHESYTYASFGYQFNMKGIKLSPFMRYSIFWFGRGHRLTFGLSVSPNFKTQKND